MKDEKTTYDNANSNNEDTLLDNRQMGAKKQNKENVAAKPSRAKWVKIAGGAGTGLLLGSVAMLMMSSKPADGEIESSNGDTPGHEGFAETDASATAAGSIPQADSVSEDMSFGEAFAAARQEFGPGATFVWHGNVYSTYLAEEWQKLTAAQQDGYYNQATGKLPPAQTDTVEDVEVDTQNDSHVDNPTNEGENEEHMTEQEQFTVHDNMEVEVLGVYHEEDQNSELYGSALYQGTVDGHQAILVDAGNDGTIEGFVVDVNDDGNISENEIFDASDQGLTIDQFTEQTDPPQNICVDDNTLPDYSNDINDADFNV